MNQAQRIKERAALASIGASALLTVAKFAAGLLSGSLALLSEAGNNLIDTGVTFITFYAVRLAGKPADEEHNYGHGKVESLAALIETAFLFALAAFIVIEAVLRLWQSAAPVHAGVLAFGVLIVSIIVDVFRVIALSRIARETKSDALAADVVNFISDIIGSSIALLGLIAARFGFSQGDAIAALAVAIYIGVSGYKLGRRTVDTLIDAAPKGLAPEVRATAGRVPGVIAVDNLRLRPVGPNILGDIEIRVARTLPQDEVTAIKGNVSAAIASVHPGVELTVETTPAALNSETVLERLLLIAAKRRVPIHHATIQQIGGKTALSCDVEVDGAMPLGQAHEVASGLEAQIRRELGPDIEVETHIEPLAPEELLGQDAAEDVRADIARALAAAADGEIHDIHNVRVRQTTAGLVVNYHCRAAPGDSVIAVHRGVDELERKVRAEFPAIVRIVGHAEPLR